MSSTYAPPARPDQLPTNRADWRRRTGLTDPAVVAAYVTRRLSADPFGNEPKYADFFVTT